MDEPTIIGVTVVGLGLTALAIQNIYKYSGKKLVLYVLSLLVLGTLGALAAHSTQKYAWPFGLLLGLAAVELSKPIGVAVRTGTRAFLGRFFDKLSAERAPGYSADTDEDSGERS